MTYIYLFSANTNTVLYSYLGDCKVKLVYTAIARGTKISRIQRKEKMVIVNKIALAIAIIGTINWGLVGLFSFDLVAWIAGGSTAILARIIYIVVALAGLWCISLLFKPEDDEAFHRA